MTNTAELTQKIDTALPSLIESLGELIRIPSVSSDPSASKQMEQSAQAVLEMFSEIGFTARICRSVAKDGTVGQPAVLGRKQAARNAETAPTVLLYAHHDVQPVDESRWSHPPFELTRKGDRLFGRGSADDGAGIVVHLGAVGALGDTLPVNIVLFIEGEEEIGSPTFTAFLEEHRDELEADVIIVADSNNWKTEIPALTASLRGVVSVDVNVKVLDHGVHSGMFGGPILDAVVLASRLITTLHDSEGSVAVKGLGGTDRADVHWEEDDFRRDASVVDGYRLAGTGDLASRVWTQPAISIIGMDARPVKDASNTIAPECSFRVSLRTVPGVSPAKSRDALIKHLEENAPFGVHVDVVPVESGPGYIADLDTPSATALQSALEQSWGVAPVAIGVGGSIPFVSDFQRQFPNAQVLVTGVEDPRANAHSEDESASALTIRNAALAEAIFLQGLDS